MTTSKSRSIVSLCFETDPSFEINLARLCSLVEESPEDAIIVAPEVCLSGFDYERFDEAAEFTPSAIDRLLKVVKHRLLIFTAIAKKGEGIYNIAYALHNGAILHTQPKTKLFPLSGEVEHFCAGDTSTITPFVFEGITIGILICFELRFKALWQALEGCDIIAVPAQWGKIRAEHFETLTNALAIMNQCYVIASDADNEDTTGLSGIITPFGTELRNQGNLILISQYEARTVSSMRRYLAVGIK